MEGDETAARSKSLLFTLRLWSVNEDPRAPYWRARLQNIRTGEVYYCGDGRSLITLLDELLLETFEENEKRNNA